MKAILLACVLAVPAHAGTLTVEWTGGTWMLERDKCGLCEMPDNRGPYPETQEGNFGIPLSFVFRIKNMPERFEYAGAIEERTWPPEDVTTSNPSGAVLLSRPDSYEPFDVGEYRVSVGPEGASVTGDLMVFADDLLEMRPDYISWSENAWLYAYRSEGEWTAKFATTPLPASLPLMGVGLAVLAFIRRRRAVR